MRLNYLFIYLLGFTCLLRAQNNLIILDEKGQKFFLFIDGKQINDSAQSEVKAVNIYDDTCRIRVLFRDKSLPEFSAKVFLELNARSISNRDFTYSISKEKHKERLRFISVNNSLSDTTAKNLSPEVRIKSIFTAREKQKEESDRVNEIYPAPAACIKAINDSIFQKKLQLLRDNHIELNRIKDAKWFVSHYCINANQLIQVVSVFDYKNAKVRIAEFSYDYIQDHRNFLQVVNAMEPGIEKTELKKFYDKRIEK